MNGFLPVTKEEIAERGWDSPDFVYVTGDAYVDHPSFGAAVITRVLEKEGFRIGVIAQPDWRDEKAFLALGRPRLGFLVSSGNLDSMVAHYTAAKKRRHDDAYSPGRRAGLRPDRAVETYCRAIRRAVPDAVILIGGMEASLRRFAHYDYWADEVLESILFSSGADLLSYGMGESSVTAVARRLAAGERISDITDVPGTCVKRESVQGLHGYVECPGFEKVKSSKDKYMDAALLQLGEQDPVRGKTVVQRQRRGYLVQNPPAAPLSGAELDAVYELPYTRTYHPMYESMGGVPAITEVKFSIIHNRGCFGGCNFCSLAFHQGRYVTARSHQSVLREAKQIIADKDFKGYIHDVGGPTANFRRTSCDKQHKSGLCRDRRCLAPGACPNLQVDHQDYLQLLRKLRTLPGVKKVFIRSGIRFDYIMADRDESFFKELVEEHVSGQLKVAPEHLVNHVLDYMGKPHNEVFDRFRKRFYELSAAAGKEQYLVPYLMSSHPGSTLQDAVKLAEYLKKNHIRPEQVQDFYPTPGTLSTAMYYTELDPKTRKKLYVAKTPEDKRRQRILLQYYDPRYQREVAAALIKAGRRDLIGMEPRCLIRPLPGMGGAPQRKQGGKTAGNRGRRGAARWQNEAPQKGGRRKKITAVVSVLAVLLATLLAALDMTGVLPVERLEDLFTGRLWNSPSVPAAAGDTGDASIHIIDCGQGDSVLIRLDGKNVLIDGTTGSNAGQVLEYLHRQGVESLDLLIVTHPHEDHIGGLDDVLGDMPVKEVLMKQLTGSMVPTTKAYERLLTAIKANGSTVTAAQPGQKLTVGNGVFTVLGPTEDFGDLNNTSVVVKLEVGNGTALFMGDAEKESEAALVSRWYDALAGMDVLKVGHHGSSTSSGEDFIRIVSPRYAAISVGEGNDYGHPSDEVLARLEQAGAAVSRTDRDGTIVYTLQQDGFRPQQ